MNLKDTLNLPKTEFPMRGNLVKREPERLKRWAKLDLYAKVQEQNKDGDKFILHDGPPFTNGDVHIGTALNKTLKDIVVRYKSMRGYKTPFQPGWDCHGLPIEDKVARQLKAEKLELGPLEIRQRCAAFSREFIEVQRRQFERLGLLADWTKEYRTMNPAYEADILRCFAKFVEEGLVYRGKKPVYWSIPYQTALAEAEIEYRQHTSIAVYVTLPVTASGESSLPERSELVIWTTTPWTLPANLAVAVHPRFEYVVYCSGDRHFVVAAELLESFKETCDLAEGEVVARLRGEQLVGVTYQHPFIDRLGQAFPAEFVTSETGTGIVHIAPGHGMDDYQLGLQHGLKVYCPVDDAGNYLEDGQIPAALVGKSVLDGEKPSEANRGVLTLLKESNALLKSYKYHHSYPHCWRSKTPVVFRAVDQWFVSIDKKDFRKRALEAIGDVQWTPQWGESRIRGSVEARPDWCISRQRSWGVPIPVFITESGENVLDAGIIRAVADRVELAGTDAWFSQSADELLEGVALPESLKNGGQLTKGADTLDVWFDSGSSHLAVLARDPDLSWPADLYLEGSDQHRGWFQSSLWTAVINKGSAPYKQVLTHSFIINTDGKKVSKSEGKPQTSDSYVGQYGADILRLWIASEDFRSDIPISDEILNHVSGAYRGIRNTLRFLLGNLHDFDSSQNAVETDQLDLLDKWALGQLKECIANVTAAYEEFAFHKVYQIINRFCSVTLSATYHDILKDRLYTLAPDDFLRRSSQTVLEKILLGLIQVLNPILPYTADEAYCYWKADQDDAEGCPQFLGWPDMTSVQGIEDSWTTVGEILKFKANRVNEPIEALRMAKTIGQSLDAKISISGDPADDLFKILVEHEEKLPELFGVSQVLLNSSEGSELKVEATHADGVRCPRTWRWVSELQETAKWGQVSPRCKKVHDRIYSSELSLNQ